MRPSPLALAALLCATVSPAAEPLRGVYLSDIDRSVEPCTDIYGFANGTWRRENPIPPSMSRWNRRFASSEAAKDQLQVILDEVSAKRDWPAGSVEQLIGDHYAACLDESRADALGADPIRPVLAAIDAVQDVRGLAPVLLRLHELDVDVPFWVAPTADNRDPTRVVADVTASGLGLPDRDYYFKTEPRFAKARDDYKRFVARSLTLLGVAAGQAAKDAETIFALETKLAEASLDRVALRDPKATDHIGPWTELQKLAPRFDWDAYFTAAGLPRGELNVSEPAFLKAVDAQFEKTPLADWKTYLRWHVLYAAAPWLSRPFVEEHFAFTQKDLRGVKEMKPRKKRCVENVDALLGEALGQKYVEKHFPPAAKARVQEMVADIRSAMKDTIEGLDWMSSDTKTRALEKLATFHPKIGYPDRFKDYSSLKLKRDTLWENVAAARRFGVKDDRDTIGKPVDRNRWFMTPPTSNAYYNPSLNEIVFPAGILQPPGFDLNASDPINYGSIGFVIGHEISHGFDDQGAQFDAQGRLRNWWTDEDLKKFQARGACVADQFDTYAVEPGVFHKGRLVLGEAIGDLAGAKLAYLGLKKAMARRPAPVIDGFTPEQQFFIAYGQFRGDSIRPETQRLMVQSDPHPTGQYRVIGTLSNMPEFQAAFSCPADAPMVRKNRCQVW
jgi:putative endopeptidase